MTETARLASNLSIVEQNVKIFSTIISETSIPGTESAQDAALLSKLDTSCRQMQSRLSALLSELDPEAAGEVFMDALRINDELNNVFLRYERFCRSRPQNKSTRESSSTSPTTSEPATGMLIDLGSENSSGTHLTNQTSPQSPTQPSEAEYWLNSGGQEQNSGGNSEFDQFLKTRANK